MVGNASCWALHMGLSSNFRYQALNGLDMVGLNRFLWCLHGASLKLFLATVAMLQATADWAEPAACPHNDRPAGITPRPCLPFVCLPAGAAAGGAVGRVPHPDFGHPRRKQHGACWPGI